MSSGQPVADVEERELLESLRSGEDGAFERMVRTHGPRMLAVSRRILRSEEDARDALQESFLSAFRSLDGFKGDARLGTWLHRITVNAALMKLRSARRRPETSIEALLPRYLEDGHHETPPAPWRETGTERLEREQLRRLVRDRIDELPDRYRTVLLLRDIEELSTEETAEMLEITANAVKIRLHRARQALRQLLDPHLRDEA
ncbi:MAG: sigma-70 family RNA polymerase sigma factor [Myxococcota bacterium]